MSLTPKDVTARSEHTGLANAGEIGSECKICALAAGVKFAYDDPWKTPITDLEVRLADMSGGVLVDAMKTEAPANRGAADAAPGTGALRPDLGGVTHGEVPASAGFLTATTNPSQDIPTVAEEAWQLEQDIVRELEAFETSMKATFRPYVEEWERDGVIGAAVDFNKGVLRGIGNWWDGEKDFWGTAWGALKSSAAAIGDYIGEANDEGLPWWLPGAVPLNVGAKIARDTGSAIVGLFQSDGVMDYLEELGELMRAFLAGDIDRIATSLGKLTGLEALGGVIGEFGAMIREATTDGIDWIRDMIEVLRRTPVLNLMVNTAMRCLLLMTPNFWAGVIGEGLGFIVPELLIWLITTIIAALSAGAGAAALASRCASIASKIRTAISGGQHVAKILAFLDGIQPIFSKVGALAKKLRQSIDEVGTRIIHEGHVVVRKARYWEQRLDELASQGHGPQRHEGDVTDVQLLLRSMLGHDPMTGTVVDYDKFLRKYGVPYNPAEHGRPPTLSGEMIDVPGKGTLKVEMSKKILHATGDHATKINTKADYVRAYDEVLKHPDFKAFLKSAEADEPIRVPAKDIFGSNFQARFKGYDLNGDPTVFGPDTQIVAVFEKGQNGTVKLITLYPDP
ncbi:hypothetical protein FHY55_17585 [Oceanicola sp. D3]|uniref:hypothetical protein n=1 Tax=Oceanicola sp. D3 TaxID=2587163 RepID=UPI00111EC5FB|nr:hypothetical protein [Oceanicola sp. D3]QDC10937.1 hypothetical protein FHY55_17585 [Oceanicola sp. D3]